MLVRINNKLYIKVYPNRYNGVEFKKVGNNINLVPTSEVLEPTSDTKMVECNVQVEKEKFIKKMNNENTEEVKPVNRYRKY